MDSIYVVFMHTMSMESYCMLVSQARPFPFHSADCFQYRHAEEGLGLGILKAIGAAERKGSGLRD